MARRLTPADLIGKLRGAGYSVKDVSDLLGRNNRMVYRVVNGERAAPDGWEESLRKAWANVSNRARHGRQAASVEQLRKVTPEPARKVKASGAAPRLRTGVWTSGTGWATGLVGRQAARSGALALVAGVEAAVSRMWRLAVTVAFREHKRGGSAVRKGAKWYAPKQTPRRPGSAKRASYWYATANMIPTDLLTGFSDGGSTSLTVAILEQLVYEELIAFDAIEDALREVEQIEMRIWA